ncbi:ABC transporter ATP-binding protein [Sneathiella litorea]|uniref:ATP-binding cassette domain-containing protein n=1 Tax=Sneathiella litorea TaxID=2606216 RepID=A0A6L8W2A0_9PROT|nr:ABC transporter ATP-binding protein [Sneathiella litorea]MZR29166.1 ATP-binding cassette domain-containing protein [Sneathiella litorea]
MSENTLLEVQDLKVHFGGKKLFRKAQIVHAVDGVSFTVPKGKAFGILGESGAGKTTTALAVLRLVPLTDGTVRIDDAEFSALRKNELREARHKVQIIFQDPYSSLNPHRRIGDIVREPLDLMDIGLETDRDQMVLDLFVQVGLQPELTLLFPHQISGGQKQQVCLARALATKPALIVCDEPVSAIDISVRAQILNLMRKLQEDLGLTYLFFSRDPGVVQYLCDHVAVMYLGQVVEQADRIALFSNPQHPYTKALLAAVPKVRPQVGNEKKVPLAGDPPSPINLPMGCRFADRCPVAFEKCYRVVPELKDRGNGHMASCHLLDKGLVTAKLGNGLE